MDIKQIIKEKIENAKKERDEAKNNEHLCTLLDGEVSAYYDCLSLIEQSEKPMNPINIDNCPKCGTWLTRDCHFCPHCGQPLDWGEGEKK